jgi:hypothetical protein
MIAGGPNLAAFAKKGLTSGQFPSSHKTKIERCAASKANSVYQRRAVETISRLDTYLFQARPALYPVYPSDGASPLP